MAIRTDARKRHRNQQVSRHDPVLVHHFQRLGIQSVTEYRQWCVEHGFPPSLDKTPIKLKLEVRTAQEAQIQLSLAKKPKTPQEIITDIFRGQPAPADTPTCMWSYASWLYEQVKQSRNRCQDTLRLCRQVADCDGFFKPGNAEVFGLPHCHKTYFDGLLAIAQWSSAWIRPIETWKPRCRHPRQQFSSLVRHLFAEYPIPLFMDSIWFSQESLDPERLRNWFCHLGRGQNLRTADLPLHFTKRMAHAFMHAPVHYRVSDALRWGQIMGLGGTSRLVEAVCATTLGEDFSDNEFWVSVFQFFIANPRMNLSHVGPIIDFLKDQRQPGFQINREGVRVEVPAPHPNYSMKGRTPQSLIRQMEDWHQRLEDEEHPNVQWDSMNVPGYEQIEGDAESGTLRKWTVTELLSSTELVAESRAMHHCVASYINNCLDRCSSIWSIRLESTEGITSQVTIEVRPYRKQIVQARGRYNTDLTGFQRLMLDRWAKCAGLILGIDN